MKALGGSVYKINVVFDKTINNCEMGTSFCSWRQYFSLKKHQVGFFTCKNSSAIGGFLHLVCFKYQKKPFSLVGASSSDPPQSQAELVKSEVESTSKTVHVKFQLQKQCLFGEQFMIVGDDPILGLWDPESAVAMKWSDGHVWSVELDIPVEKSIQFKIILKGSTGKICWQPGGDRVLKAREAWNSIVVFEDWDNEALQKIVEEEGPTSSANSNEEAAIADSNLSEPVVAKNPMIADNIAENLRQDIVITNRDASVEVGIVGVGSHVLEQGLDQVEIRNNEVANHNVPKIDEMVADWQLQPTHQEASEVSKDEQHKFEQKTQAEGEEGTESDSERSYLRHYDMQCSTRTMHKLLNDLGLQ